MLRATGGAFLLALPFSALAKPGLLGNFDANLALYPLLALVPMLAVSGHLAAPLRAKGSEAVFLRCFAGAMALCALLTILNGWWFAIHARALWTFGQDPLARSLVTAVVPLFLVVLLLACIATGQLLGSARLQRLMLAGFWLTVAYTALQALSTVVPLPVYGQIATLIEGARDHGGRSYVEVYHRLNGATQEPAELAKLVGLLFLPWIAFPAEGRARPVAVLAALGLMLATQSIVGLLLSALALALLLAGRDGAPRNRPALLAGLLAAILLLPLVAGDVPLLHRLAGLGEDPSTAIRLHYNLAALEILRENLLIGVGWSNELYLFAERIGPVAHLPEVREDLVTGDALTARSLFLRLAMYLGLPLFALLLAALLRLWRRPCPAADPTDRARLRFALPLFVLGATVDGGMLTSMFLWAALALPLSVLLPCALSREAKTAPGGAPVPA